MNASSQPATVVADVACADCASDRERTAQFQAELLAIVGHDLRAPLAAILLSTELLGMASSDPSASAAVTRIASFTKRMTRMIDQLTDLTRTRLGGGIPLALQKLRLGTLVSSVVERFARTFPQSRFQLLATQDIVGVWDGDRLMQVFEAVLANAVRHGLADGLVDISVSTRPDEATIAIRNDVRDEPLSAGALATWFTARDHTHAGPGLGLDLHIAREIIHAHHGRITARSSSAGTTIRIVLPTTREPARG